MSTYKDKYIKYKKKYLTLKNGGSETVENKFQMFQILKFKENFQSLLNVILTNDKSLLNEKNVDVIQFTDTEEFIDLSSVIHDLVLLEEPIKRLCKKSCKGLCPACGKNLNETTCTCTVSEYRSRWDALKNLNN